MLVNHDNYSSSPTNPQGRNNLTALLSDDECKTWKYKLLLDERDQVSYPDVTEADDGFIYVTYDRERGCGKKSMDEACSEAREILFAKVCEKDIMAGELVNPDSKLKCVISGLGKYDGEDNPFEKPNRQAELARFFAYIDKHEMPERIFKYYRIENMNMTIEESTKLDELVEELENSDNREDTIYKLVMHLAFIPKREAFPLVDIVITDISENISIDLTDFEIADKIGVSRYYLRYVFKKLTGLTTSEYRNSLRLTMAKEQLVSSDKTLNEVTEVSGYGSLSSMIESFIKNEKISPSEYRERMKS